MKLTAYNQELHVTCVLCDLCLYCVLFNGWLEHTLTHTVMLCLL